MKGHIYFIMGQSGSGKGTVISKLQESNIPHLHIPLSYKTRAIRETEVNHVDSHFITKEAFVHAIEQGEFLEYAYVYE
ncbi:MAG: hypothetical protein H6767_07085 [Candidatus Peribacteria bacterium]|nr:MAG: hypothetical protein H6767_07085 [Candidatus Peribacteria bacterium]